MIVNCSADADGTESVVSAIRASGGRAAAARADVASEGDVEAMFDRAEEQMGRSLRCHASQHRGPDGVRQARRPGDVDCPRWQGRVHRHHRLRRRPGPGRPARDCPLRCRQGRSGDIRARPVQRVASEGIRVNSVSPWVIATDMAFPEAQQAAKHSPLGRMGQPEEFAATVSWVISPEASFVTHSDISVSGGL